MKAECIECLIDCNREIEFSYQGKRYSITYIKENDQRSISICEFYKQPVNVKTSQEVLNFKIGSLTLESIFSKLPDSAFDIF